MSRRTCLAILGKLEKLGYVKAGEQKSNGIVGLVWIKNQDLDSWLETKKALKYSLRTNRRWRKPTKLLPGSV